MSAGFRVRGLDAAQFASWFAMDDAGLAQAGAARIRADAHPGYPCRVSLEDARVGETVLALNWPHHDALSPYRASGPIFVREGAGAADLPAGEIPPVFAGRLLSVRAYDDRGWMVAAEITDGEAAAKVFEVLLDRPGVAFLHVHNAGPGCYSCRVERA